jgi:hypothetical protein
LAKSNKHKDMCAFNSLTQYIYESSYGHCTLVIVKEDVNKNVHCPAASNNKNLKQLKLSINKNG